MDLKTIRDLKKLDIFALNKECGRKNGGYIFNSARGIDNEPVKESEPTIQFSRIITLKKDSRDFEFLIENLKELCKDLHGTIIKNRKMFKSVGIQFIQSDLSNRTKSRMLKNPTNSLEELLKNTEQLLRDALEDQQNTIRRLGVKVSELSEVKGQSNITSYF